MLLRIRPCVRRVREEDRQDFQRELKHGGETVLHIGKVDFPVRVNQPRWNERHNAVCLDLEFKALSLRGKKVKNHILRIAFKGYETA